MKVAYYETRKKFKQVTYIKHFDMMHGWWVIKCMNSRDFSANLQSQDKSKNIQAEKIECWAEYGALLTLSFAR